MLMRTEPVSRLSPTPLIPIRNQKVAQAFQPVLAPANVP